MDVRKLFKENKRYKLITTDADACFDIIADYIAFNINSGWKCMYHTENTEGKNIGFWLKKNNVDFEEAINSGKLVIGSSYKLLIENNFYGNSELMMKMIDEAKAEGYKGLSFILDKDCFFDNHVNEAILYRFEEAAEEIYSNNMISSLNIMNIDKFGVDAFYAMNMINSNFIYKFNNDVLFVNEKDKKYQSEDMEIIFGSFMKEREVIVRKEKTSRFISSLSEDLSYRKDEKEILQLSLQRLCKETYSDFGYAFILKKGNFIENMTVDYNAPPDIVRMIKEKMVSRFVSSRSKKTVITDMHNLEKIPEHVRALLIKNNVYNSVHIPLTFDGDDIGIFWIGTRNKYTDYKKYEELFSKSAKTISRIIHDYWTFKGFNDNMHKANKINSLGELSTGIAHEFNNVLMPIFGITEILKSKIQDESVVKYLEMIENSARDGARIVGRINDYARPDDNQKEGFRIDDLILSAIDMSKPKWSTESQIGKKNINVRLDLNSEAVIQGNSTEIKEVMVNLISNAVDAIDNKGEIYIRTEKCDGKAIILLRDSGAGMNKEVKERIFEPFYSTKKNKGMGLGLYISYNIIKNHGGEIVVESKESEGTAFTIMLPVSGEEKKVKKSKEEKKLEKGFDILVIDDQKAVAFAVAEMLNSIGNHTDIVYDESLAIEKFKSKKYDIVFCDLALIKTSGIELSRELKKINPEVPFVLTTGWTGKISKEDLKTIDKILYKPFSTEDLANVINEFCKKNN